MTIAQKLRTLVQSDRILSTLQSLEEVYAALEEEQKKWIEASPFRCPVGCGRCCERFVPDMWEIEALYIAGQLLIEGRDSLFQPSQSFPCPLYRAEGEFHCTVYETRPLVCRVFGFAGDRDKWGHLRYAPCRHMALEEGQQVVSTSKMWTEQELVKRFAALPPDMTLFARRVQAIEPSWAIEREPLDTALPKALMKLRLYAWFSSPDKAA